MSLVRPITRRDIKGPALYGPIRDDYRQRVIAMKRSRRVLIGDRVSLVFENRHTLSIQIEEICRAEHLTTDAQIDAYTALKDLVGLDEHVVLHIGPHAIRAAFEPGRSTEDKISAVQYTRYPLSPEARASLDTAGTEIAVAIDHPNYRHRVVCPEATRASLAADYA